MSAVRRVYQNDGLVRHILDHLDTAQLLAVLTLDKSFFRLVIGILWRHVQIEDLADLDYYGSPRIAEYRGAVRYIDANSRTPYCGSWGYMDTESKFASLREKYPGLLGYSEDDPASFDTPRRKADCYPGGGGVIRYSYDEHVCAGGAHDPPLPPTLPPSPVWRGYRTICWIGLTFSVAEPFVPEFTEWLVSGNFDPRVSRLDVGWLGIGLIDLGRVLEARIKTGEQPITELRSIDTPSFTFDQFAAFADKAGAHLERLMLCNQESVNIGISTLNLSSIVSIVRDKFPKLTVLHLELAGCPNHDGSAPDDHNIPVSALPYDGALRKVTIDLHEKCRFEEYRGDIPFLAIARNLACLGGRECQYELRVQDEQGYRTDPWRLLSVRLTAIVKFFQGQPLPNQQQLAKTDFRIDLFMSNPSLDDLNSLTFTRDGRPIPPRVVELRKKGVKRQRTKRLGDVLLRYMAEALSKQSATLVDDPWALEWLLRGAKHFVMTLHLRKEIDENERELERSLEQLGWSLMDPDPDSSRDAKVAVTLDEGGAGDP